MVKRGIQRGRGFFFDESGGFLAIEMALTMLLLLMFGVGIFILSTATGEGYRRIADERDQQSALRIAGAYVANRVRQNDAQEGLIFDVDYPALVVREVFGASTYETYVYFNDGVLREATVPEGTLPDDAVSFEIVPLDRFEFEASEAALTVHIGMGEDADETWVLTPRSGIAIRSGGVIQKRGAR